MQTIKSHWSKVSFYKIWVKHSPEFFHLKHSTPKKPLQPRYKIFWDKNWMGLREGNRREPNIFGIFPGCFWIGPMSPNPSPYRTQRPLFPLGDSVWRNAFLLCWEGTEAQSWTDCRGGQTCAKHSLAPRDVFATRLVRSLRKSHSQIKNCMDVLMADTHFQLHPPCHPPSPNWWFSYRLLSAAFPYIQTWKTKEKHLNNIATGKRDPMIECFYCHWRVSIIIIN